MCSVYLAWLTKGDTKSDTKILGFIYEHDVADFSSNMLLLNKVIAKYSWNSFLSVHEDHGYWSFFQYPHNLENLLLQKRKQEYKTLVI